MERKIHSDGGNAEEGDKSRVKRLIIGDIHGCFTELQELLDQAGLSTADEIIALGDIVDRGPDSVRVLDFFRYHRHARSLMGNHERKHVRSFRGEIQPALSQMITRDQLGDAYAQAVEYIQTLPHFLELAEAILVHGFFEPNVPLESQRDTVIIGTLSGEHYLQEHYSQPWYELYDNPKPIIVGHRDYLGTGKPFIFHDRVYGIDTGCYRGGALTGLILPGFRVVSVPSRKDYWAELRREYRSSTQKTTSKPTSVWGEEADAVLNRIIEYILQEHERILKHLFADPKFAQLSPREQGKMYAAYIGDVPIAKLLHLARRGELNPERLRQQLGTLEELRSLANRLGLSLVKS